MYSDPAVIKAIPPLPATAATLLTMVADQDVDIDALARVIDRDPPLCARILGIAHSAFYAPRIPVYTTKEPIVRVLRLNTVRAIALGMALSGGLSTAACRHGDLTRHCG